MIQRRDPLRAPQSKIPDAGRMDSRTLGGLAAAGLLAALIGCGGGGNDRKGGTSTTGTTTATTGGDIATVNLPNTPGTLAFTFLTGAVRAAGDRTAVVRRINASGATGTVETRLSGERRLVLNRDSSQILDLSVPTVAGATSRLFDNIQFDVLRFETQDDDGAGGVTTTAYDTIANIPVDLPASVRVFPGRTTHAPLYLNPDTIFVDPATNAATFSLAEFQRANFGPEKDKVIQGTLSDYVAFNISGLSSGNRPSLSNGKVATRVYFSGDGYALSDGDPYAGESVGFEPLLPGGQQDVAIGRLAGPSQIPSQGGTAGETPGTYTMVQANPRDPSLRPITSLQGTWRDHIRQRITSTGTVSNVGALSSAPAFTMVTIPSSADNGRQDLIAISQTSSTENGIQTPRISTCYFGYVDYESGRLFMYPIGNITSIIANGTSGGQLQGEVTGTVSATLGASGAATSTVGSIRSGSFSITSGGTPNGFPSSGRFVVYRR